MDCPLLTQHALLLMSDVDMEDVRLGQLLTWLTGLTLLLLGRVVYLLL